MSVTSLIRAPGASASGGVAGIGLAALQVDGSPGSSTRRRAQATIFGSAAGVALGYAAITSGATIGVVLSGALAIAAAPVAVTLSVVYLLQAGTPEQAESYRNAMDVVGVTSSLGGLSGFTAKAIFGGSYQSALEFSQGAGLVERLMSAEKVAGLATGYETGSLIFEGGGFVSRLLKEATLQDVPKPQASRQQPARGRDQDIDRSTNGQRRAERAQEARERQQDRAAAQKAERQEKPGKGETPSGPRQGGGSGDRSTGKAESDSDRKLRESLERARDRAWRQ